MSERIDEPLSPEFLDNRSRIGYGVYIETCRAFGFEGEPDTSEELSEYFDSSPLKRANTPRLVQFQIDRRISKDDFEPIHDTLMRTKVLESSDASKAFPEYRVDFTKQPGLASYMLENLVQIRNGTLRSLYPARQSVLEYQPYLPL